MRDRLRNLLIEWGNSESDGIMSETLTDFLLANGVIVPPCKVGDTVYAKVERLRMPRGVYQGIIKNIILTEEQVFVITKLLNNSEVTTLIQDIFHSKEEAEEALKGGAK